MVMPLRLSDTIQLGSVTLRNRVFVPAHTTNLPGSADTPGVSDTSIHQRYLAYLLKRARGGPGLIITEAVRAYPPTATKRKMNVVSERAVEELAVVTQAIHETGTALFAQMNEPGRHSGSSRPMSREVPIGPSPIPWALGGPVPHMLSKEEIRALIASFGCGAERIQRAGFDGIEIQFAHGHLVGQFLSPVANGRSDEYGGSPEARMRFGREILEAVCGAVDIPVGIRLSADEFVDGGLTLNEVVKLTQAFVEDYPLSFLDISHGIYMREYTKSTSSADMTFPPVPFADLPTRFKKTFPNIPILAACRVDDLDVAEELLASGAADMAGLVRAHIADPEVVRKHEKGRRHETRRCIACNQACLGRIEAGLPISCVVNPEVGLEREWAAVPAIHPRAVRRVLVVGAGPAGLEAAVTARRRGHEVTVREALPTPGGQIRYAAALHGRERFGLMIEDLISEAERRGVRIETESPVTAEQVSEEAWETVILATGSRPADSPVLGGVRLVSSWDAIDDPKSLGSQVAVVDEDGTWAGAGLAWHLAVQGAAVCLVSAMGEPAWNVTLYSRMALLRRLRETDVSVHAPCKAVSASDTSLLVRNLADGEQQWLEGLTGIVYVGIRVARDELRDAVVASAPGAEVFVVGDAFAPRTAMEATYEGRLAGTAVGLDNLSSMWRFEGFREAIGGVRPDGDLRKEV